MESEKRQDGFRQILGDEVGKMLRDCPMSARGFFYAILPLLEGGKPYGTVEMTATEFAEFFEVSVHHTRRYIADLKKHGILKESVFGSLCCPPLIRLKYGRPHV